MIWINVTQSLGGPLIGDQALKILESMLTILFSVQIFFLCSYSFTGTHSIFQIKSISVAYISPVVCEVCSQLTQGTLLWWPGQLRSAQVTNGSGCMVTMGPMAGVHPGHVTQVVARCLATAICGSAWLRSGGDYNDTMHGYRKQRHPAQ